MNKYTVICLRDGVKCYHKVNILTFDELQENFCFWRVYSFKELLKRWNQQSESSITKLKWIYYE